MDYYDMWDDTMLIVNTDHGFLLGEHGWLAKNYPPVYSEIANTPLFIWIRAAAGKLSINKRSCRLRHCAHAVRFLA
jgi:arylsulfatase A-like enzyme